MSSIHDCFVYSILNHLEDRTLQILAHYRDQAIPEPYFSITFQHVVATNFNHVVAPSILLDIEQVEVETIVQNNRDQFIAGLKYGWPFAGVAKFEGLITELAASGANGYIVMGTCGLDGFVIAERMSVYSSRDPLRHDAVDNSPLNSDN